MFLCFRNIWIYHKQTLCNLYSIHAILAYQLDNSFYELHAFLIHGLFVKGKKQIQFVFLRPLNNFSISQKFCSDDMKYELHE